MADSERVLQHNRRTSTEEERHDLETRIEESMNKTLGMYDKMYKQNFVIIEENQLRHSTKLDNHVIDQNKWQEKQTENITKLRETVNNGLTHKVAAIQKSMYWFIGIWITVTGGIFAGLFWIISLMKDLHI